MVHFRGALKPTSVPEFLLRWVTRENVQFTPNRSYSTHECFNTGGDGKVSSFFVGWSWKETRHAASQIVIHHSTLKCIGHKLQKWAAPHPGGGARVNLKKPFFCSCAFSEARGNVFSIFVKTAKTGKESRLLFRGLGLGGGSSPHRPKPIFFTS